MDRQFWLGLMGAALLFVGVFTPVVQVPLIGDISFLGNNRSKGLSFVIIAIAIAALVITIAKIYKWLLLTGLASLLIISFSFFYAQAKLEQMTDKITKSDNSDLGGGIAKGIAEITSQSIQLKWGWAVMLIGSGLLIGASLIKDSEDHIFDSDQYFDDGRVACLYCAERIMPDAEICRYCGQDQPTDALPESVECPACGTELELNIKERKEKVYSCDECGSVIDVRGKSSRI